MATNATTLLQLLSESEASRVLAVSVAALRRWRREGRGPQFIHLERCVRYDLRALEHFVAQNISPNKKAADSQSTAQTEVRDGHAELRTN
jgi:Helix-turn-helix domain